MNIIEQYQYYILQTIQSSKCASHLPVAAILIDNQGNIHHNSNNYPHHCELNFQPNLYYGAILFVNLEPCPSCAFFLCNKKVKTIVFGAYNLQYGACGGKFHIINLCDNLYKTKIYGGIEAHKASHVLQKQFKNIFLQHSSII